LKANKLRIVSTICESTTRFIANKKAVKDPWKKAKMEQVIMLLRGAMDANGMVGLKMNIKEKDLDTILHLLSSLKNPTISNLSQKGWFAIETVIHESRVRELVVQLKAAGAQGIIEYSLNKLIY